MKKEQLDPRVIAIDILHAILRKGQSLDEMLSCHVGLPKLEKRDRAFVHALVACTLRRLGQIDAALKVCYSRPQPPKPAVLDVLRLGAAQILFLGTPHHAAVDTAVSMAAKNHLIMPYKGLINAILRRLTREGAELIADQDEAKLNTPKWLWDTWEKSYGTETARKIALANLGEALNDITVKSDPEGWAEKIGAKLLPTGSLRLKGDVPVQEIEGFDEGAWWVQDAAAALPVKIMGDLKGKRVMDLCAAPGGKTLQMAIQGAKVSALDRSEKRLGRLRENIERTGVEVAVFCADALTCDLGQKAEAILLDAPCTATGTMRRHPDVAHLKKPDDMERLGGLQAKLLDHVASDLLEDGGTLVYAVCSLQAGEAEEQVEKFLARTPNFKRLPVTPEEIGGASELISKTGDLRCLPNHWPELGGMDGFYAARLVKG